MLKPLFWHHGAKQPRDAIGQLVVLLCNGGVTVASDNDLSSGAGIVLFAVVTATVFSRRDVTA